MHGQKIMQKLARLLLSYAMTIRHGVTTYFLSDNIRVNELHGLKSL